MLPTPDLTFKKVRERGILRPVRDRVLVDLHLLQLHKIQLRGKVLQVVMVLLDLVNVNCVFPSSAVYTLGSCFSGNQMDDTSLPFGQGAKIFVNADFLEIPFTL